jgi:SAM-dependent methyltransferase
MRRMSEQTNPQPERTPDDGALWRGIDLSGVTLVLGAGTGLLLEMLCQQAALVGGLVVVAGPNRAALAVEQVGQAARLLARTRRLPLADGCVDLVVMNGALREVLPTRYEALFEELWRVLVPGGQMRIADIVEPSEASYDWAWRQRNAIVRRMAESLDLPTALAVDLRRAAMAARATGFEDLGLSLLPGVPLGDAWLQETVNALRGMLGRVPDAEVRRQISERDLPALVAAYQRGDQRAAERFVLQGRKVGSLALDMEASFTEADLTDDD